MNDIDDLKCHISSDPIDNNDACDQDNVLESKDSRRRVWFIRIVASLLVLSLVLLALSSSIRLSGLANLEFLLESRILAQDPDIKALIPTIVRVEANDRRGSGFNIDPEGLIITNEHITGGASVVNVSFQSGDTDYTIPKWIEHPVIDLSVLAVNQLNLPYLVLEDKLPAAPGDQVIIIGNPLGFFRAVQRTTVLGQTKLPGWAHPVLVLAGPVYKGSSGSPVINGDGKVVGMIFAMMAQPDSDHSVALAIPAADIIQFLDDVMTDLDDVKSE